MLFEHVTGPSHTLISL